MISKTKYKLFPNLYIKENCDHFILFNPINLSIIFIHKDKKLILDSFKFPKKINNEDQIISKLIDTEILVQQNYNYEEEIKEIYNDIISSPIFISNWYLIVSEKCNLNCSYCFIRDKCDKSISKNMTKKIARLIPEYIVKFGKVPNNILSRVDFFGGEPLINFECIKIIVENLFEYENKGYFNNKSVLKYLVTNGTLLKKEHVDFFNNYDINIAISIDGTEKIHNKKRIYKDGCGTFKDTIDGYFLMKETGKKPMISCTVGEHNVDQLPKISEYFATELESDYVGFNLMLGHRKEIINEEEFIERSINAIIKSYEILREYGVYEDSVMRLLTPIIEQKIRFRHCAAYGNQLVISPEGFIGPCHGFLSSKKYYFGSIMKTENPTDSQIIKKWYNRTPFNISNCFKCPTISICGGGCAYEAVTCNSSFWASDERYCKFSKKILNYFLDELYNNFIKKNET